MAFVGKCRFLAQGWGGKSWQLWRGGCPREGTVGEDLTVLLFPVDHDTYEFLPPSRVTFVMLRVCFKSITWYIEMHHVKAFSLCGVMTFSYYVMFIHNMFILKWKAYRVFCVSQKPLRICPGHILSSADKQRPC